jgi:hypothetical protein
MWAPNPTFMGNNLMKEPKKVSEKEEMETKVEINVEKD